MQEQFAADGLSCEELTLQMTRTFSNRFPAQPLACTPTFVSTLTLTLVDVVEI